MSNPAAVAQPIQETLKSARSATLKRWLPSVLMPLIGSLIFLLFILPLGYVIRRNDPLQLRRRASGSYLRMLDHGSEPTMMPGESVPLGKA